MRDCINQVDQNQKGGIDKAQSHSYFESKGKEDEVEPFFENLDQDGDGLITLEELYIYFSASYDVAIDWLDQNWLLDEEIPTVE